MSELYATRANSLKSLGFRDYGEYLDSKLWKSIRKRVLIRDGYMCRKCGKVSAHHVHHTSYKLRIMRGRTLDGLFSVCDWCHRDLEFNGDEKRPGDEVVAFSGWLSLIGADSECPVPPTPKHAKRSSSSNRKKTAQDTPQGKFSKEEKHLLHEKQARTHRQKVSQEHDKASRKMNRSFN